MKIVFTLALVIASVVAPAQSTPGTKHLNLADGVALQGYDPVAYITQQKAVKGKKELSVTIAGVIFYTSSAGNRELLLKNPKRYEPQYGGWCAFAMGASGEKVEVDPETFKVEDGKLYLFYNSFFNNTLPKWNKDESTLRPQADKNWASINKL